MDSTQESTKACTNARGTSDQITTIKKPRTLFFHMKPLFLSTKTDFKTVVLPQSMSAISMCLSGTGQILAPDRDPIDTMMCIPYMLVWLWLHLLILDVGNQRLHEGILEDAVNKPWRPMPTGRLSPEETQGLLRALVPISTCVGLAFGSFTPSVAFITLAYLYNDLDASSSGPITRNLLNTAGLSCLGWGAISCLLGGEISSEGSRLLKTWMAVVAAMLLTTVHAQDFPDLVGDHARGRRTVPLVYGIKWSRLVVAVLAIVWSVTCAAFWGVCSLGWLVTLALGGGLAVSILLPWEKPDYKNMWRLWCVWATAIYTLPLFVS